MKDIIINKPKQARSKAKFSSILTACTRVFESKGYRKSTAAEIALEADVGIGTLYDYFSCKEAVFIAYLDTELVNALEEVELIVQRETESFSTLIRALCSVGISFAFNHKNMLSEIVVEEPEIVAKFKLADSRRKVFGIAQKAAIQFWHHQELEGVKDKPADLIVYSLTNIVLGFQLRIVMMQDGNFDQETLVDELSRTLLSYLAS